MEIKFKNALNKFITQQQASALITYDKCYYNTHGIVCKEESFYEGELTRLLIYNYNNESHQTLISNNLNFGYKGISIVDVTHHNYGYKLHKMYNYRLDGTLNGINLDLFDSMHNVVAYGYQEPDGIYEYDRIRKFYFDHNINTDKYLFECTYEDNGDLWGLDWNNEHLNNSGQDRIVFYNTPEDKQKLIDLTGMSQSLVNYYMSFEIEPDF